MQEERGGCTSPKTGALPSVSVATAVTVMVGGLSAKTDGGALVVCVCTMCSTGASLRAVRSRLGRPAASPAAQNGRPVRLPSQL